MLASKTIVALAAVASMGALALAGTDASARGFGGGSGMRMGGGHVGHVNSLRVGGGGNFHRVGGGNFHRIGHGIGHGINLRHPGRPPIFVHHRPHIRWGWGWRRHYWVAPVIATTGVATGVVATAPTWNRCTCLTKEYTPDGAVVF